MESLFSISKRVRWILLPAMAFAVLLAIGDALGALDSLEERIALPLTYRLRERLGRDPGLDPRISIYALGDSTLQKIQADDLKLAEWAELLESLVPNHPRAVIIPKMFGIPRGLEDSRAFVSKLRALPFPVIASALLTPQAIPERKEVSLNRAPYDAADWVTGSSLNGPAWDVLGKIPVAGDHVYGPHPAIVEAFSELGHFLREISLEKRAFVRITPRQFVPYAPLLIARDRKFTDKGLYLDGRRVPLERDGKFLVNLGSPQAYRSHIFSLWSLMERARRKEAHPILPDSVIVLLPHFFSGNLEMQRTPYGMRPASYADVATIHSVLTGQWIERAPLRPLFILASGLLGVACAWLLRGLLIWPVILAGIALHFALGIASFAYGGYVLPWHLQSLALAGSAAIVFALLARETELREKRIRQCLQGALGDERMQALIRGNRLLLEPTSRVVTVLFVDVVGFSRADDSWSPKDAFLALKSLMGLMTKIVHSFGGVVDKTMGDGLLCFFGYHYDGTEPVPDHADRAVGCALAIQRECLSQGLSAQGLSADVAPFFPLRIGINTAAVYIGNMGNDERIDFTIVGRGVNFAKRLETACEIFSVLIGPSTRDMVMKPEGLSSSMRRRYIQIKHFDELLEAWELDPFESNPELLGRARQRYREFAKLERKEARWDLPSSMRIGVAGSVFDGEIVNFSMSGIGIRSTRYLGIGVTVSFEITTENGNLAERLRAQGLLPLIGEIRWGRPLGDSRYYLGLLFKNLNPNQKRLWLEEFRKELNQQTLKIVQNG